MTFSLNVEGNRKPPRKREEASLQACLFRDLQTLLPHDAFLFSVPNGGTRNAAEAANLKRQGLVAGIPDLVFIYRGKAFGLELKSQGGFLSDSQKRTFPMLRTAGMRIEVARSHPEALERIREFGIPLRLTEATKHDARNMFREESKRRPA